MPKEVAVFDLDGTLIDTMSAHADLFGKWANENFGIDIHQGSRHYLNTAGLPTSKQISSLLELNSLVRGMEDCLRWGKTLDTQLEGTDPKVFPDVPQTLEELKELGFRICVSSSHTTSSIGRILERARLAPLVEAFVGVNPADPQFTKGERHYRALSATLNINYHDFVRDSVLIGDGLSDMNAASSVGMVAIGIQGIFSPDQLRKAGANYVIQNVGQLVSIISTL